VKKNKKRLKLTKLTVANLDRLKGGEHPPCVCDFGAFNRANNDAAYTVKSCIVCPLT
jgi:hypothetical protein